jgi:hypothetical protein
MTRTSPRVTRDGSMPDKAIREDQWVGRRRKAPGLRVAMPKLMRRDSRGGYLDELTLVAVDERGDWSQAIVRYFDVTDVVENSLKRLDRRRNDYIAALEAEVVSGTLTAEQAAAD